MKDKHNKSLSFAVVVLVVLSAISMRLIIGWSELKAAEDRLPKQREQVLLEKWDSIYLILLGSYHEAGMMSEKIKDNIVMDVQAHYLNNDDLLLQDLKKVTSSEECDLMSVIGKRIEGQYLYGIENDNNDPNVMAIVKNSEEEKKLFVSDLSQNSASFSPGRSFEEEVNRHFNKRIAEEALKAIIDPNQKDTIKFWMFLGSDQPKLHSRPFYNDLLGMKHMDVNDIKDLFIKYDGDLELLSVFEFIATDYIYRDKDIIGNPFVGHSGNKLEGTQLIVNSGFNLVDIIKDQPEYYSIIKEYDMKLDAIDKEFDVYKQHKIILIAIESLSFFLAFVALTKLQNSLYDQLRKKKESTD